MSGDTAGVKTLCSDELVKKADKKIGQLILSTAAAFNAREFEVMDEFYSSHPVNAQADTLSSNRGNANDYLVTYKATTQETYTALLVTKGQIINCLILAIYGKYGDRWKVNVLQVGEFVIDNKTAQDYFRDANRFFDQGQIVDASNAMELTSQLALPAGDFFRYRNEAQMRGFDGKLSETAFKIYNYPLTMKDVSTGPQIYEVIPQVVSDKEKQGVFPLIKYVTKIDLDNIAGLKAENDVMQKAISALFLGIDKNNKYILYQAVNATADGMTSVRHYGFVQKTTKN